MCIDRSCITGTQTVEHTLLKHWRPCEGQQPLPGRKKVAKTVCFRGSVRKRQDRHGRKRNRKRLEIEGKPRKPADRRALLTPCKRSTRCSAMTTMLCNNINSYVINLQRMFGIIGVERCSEEGEEGIKA